MTRGTATPPRRPCGSEKTVHASTASIRGPREWPRTHGGHKGLRVRTTFPRQPYGAQGIGHAPTAAIQVPRDRPRPHGCHTGPMGPATPPWRPYGTPGTGDAPKAAVRGPGDRPHPHGTIQVQGDRPRCHGGHTRPRGMATPPWRPYGAGGTVHAGTAALRGLGNCHAPTAAIRHRKDNPCLHGGHTGPRGTATPPRWP